MKISIKDNMKLSITGNMKLVFLKRKLFDRKEYFKREKNVFTIGIMKKFDYIQACINIKTHVVQKEQTTIW